jgi:hypothetical protein
MGVTAATVEEIQVGAGDVWYKGSEDTGWTGVGATMEDNVWRVERDYTVPDLNGVVAPLKGLDYLAEERVMLECSLPQVSDSILALAIPGAVSTAQSSTETGAATSLADATTAGQYLAIKLAAVTGLAVGDYIKIGAPGFKEIRQLTRVGTALIGGTGVDVDFPLQAPHSAADAVIEVDGPGGTVIVGGPDRRLPSSAYHWWRLDVPGLDGRMTRFIVKDGIMTGNAEYAASDDDAMHPRLVIAGRRDAATPQDSAWEIRKEAAFS